MTEINPIQFSTTDSPSLNSTSSNQQAKPSIFTGNMSADDTTGSSSTKKSQKFNSDGTVTTSYDYDGDGKIDMEVIFDANGEQKEKIEYSYGYRTYEDGTKVPLKTEEHEYWENDNVVKKVTRNIINGKEADRLEITYDIEGNSTSSARYENGKFFSRGEYILDELGRDKITNIYDKNNQLKTIIKYSYPRDEKRNVIAEIEEVTDVKTGEVTVTRYDENNPRVLKGTVEIGH